MEQNGFVVNPRIESIFIFGLKDGKVKASEGHSSYNNQRKVCSYIKIYLSFTIYCHLRSSIMHELFHAFAHV